MCPVIDILNDLKPILKIRDRFAQVAKADYPLSRRLCSDKINTHHIEEITLLLIQGIRAKSPERS